MKQLSLVLLFILVLGCADQQKRALKLAEKGPDTVQDYEDAAYYLASKSGVIAICRAAMEIGHGEADEDDSEYCERVFSEEDTIKSAALIWLNASERDQQRWFERHPYEFRELLNAIQDFDIILQLRAKQGSAL